LEAHHLAVQRAIYRVLANGSAHTSQVSLQVLAARRDWLQVLWLAKYAPQLNPNEREWRRLKRDARSHLATDLRAFVDGILAGLQPLGSACSTLVDAVPQWFLEGHRKPPTGRPRDAHAVALWGPRTPTSGPRIVERRTYPRILSPDYSRSFPVE
jgi:DDE superfamily endonuclease